jgi:prepilin-type N-terminal cleavage/methylation domain-containing protein
MTLVELMVTIAIIAILASIVLLGISGATEQAKLRRTQAQIAKLHELVMEKWRSYETRRVPMKGIERGERLPRNAVAAKRLLALREMMRLEMPERITDLTVINSGANEPEHLRTFPSLYYSYMARVKSTWTDQYQGAECLYLIISQITVDDSTALRYFNDSEIGDRDGDGMPEILDAWGTPIEFLRWAPGFISPLQTPNAINDAQLANLPLPQGPAGQVTTLIPYISQTTDPFDVMHVDEPSGTRNPHVLVPLVMSAGPDKVFNIDVARRSNEAPFTYFRRSMGVFQLPGSNDPYVQLPDTDTDTDTNPNQIGQVLDTREDGHIDNIYNHFLEAR